MKKKTLARCRHTCKGAITLPILKKVLMATVVDLRADFDAIEAGVKELATEIADLKANSGVVSQVELDDFDTRAKGLVTAIEAAK
jgi:hypothetical protein